jgi:Kef-type K+ transport system membrane component KefB
VALPITSFIIDLFLLLAGALLAGEAVSRFGQPALVGQLLVGVVLGPTILGPLLGLTALPPEFSSIQFLATVFILFMAGLEVAPEEIYRMGPVGVMLGIAVFAFPFAIGFLVATAVFPGVSILKALFVSLTLSITALPVMGIMLVQFGLLTRPFGKFLMNTALVNELTAVTAFAVLLQLYSGHATGGLGVGVAFASLALFLAVMLSLYVLIRALARTRIWDQIRSRFAHDWRSKGAGFAVLMVLVIGASLFSQSLGLTFVVGAFYAGLLVTRETAGPTAHKSISTVFDTISWGFFIPLFFALVGLQMNLRLLGNPVLIGTFLALLSMAILTKVGVGTFAGRVRGMTEPDSLAVGFLVSSRGAVELAMAVILLQAGVFDVPLFTIVAGVGLVTTIVAPIGALWAWQSTAESREELYQRIPTLRRPAGRVWVRAPPLAFGDVRDFHVDPTASHLRRTPLTSTPTAIPDPAPSAEADTRPPLPDRRRKPPSKDSPEGGKSGGT